MTNYEINKLLSELIDKPFLCWHELPNPRVVWIKKKNWLGMTTHKNNPDCNRCVKCGEIVTAFQDSDGVVKAHNSFPKFNTSTELLDGLMEDIASRNLESRFMAILKILTGTTDTYALMTCDNKYLALTILVLEGKLTLEEANEA